MRPFKDNLAPFSNFIVGDMIYIAKYHYKANMGK